MARQTSTGLTSTRDEGSGEVEAIEVHDLVPRGNEVVHELVLRVVTCVDLGDGSELRVRTEDEVDCCGGPVELSRHAIAILVLVLGFDGDLPLRAHVAQVQEEIVRLRLGSVREHVLLVLSDVGVYRSYVYDV